MRPAIKVGLSTASVYPLRTEAAFEYAARLGYDGVELMVWAETLSQDVDAVAALSKRYAVPVLSVHAPCLLISQRVWGANPMPKLERSVRAAERLGAQTSSCIHRFVGSAATRRASVSRSPISRRPAM